MSRQTVLLHTCCGPCASACVERLIGLNCEPVLYYSNSNINTPEEFKKRLEGVRIVAEKFRVEVLTDSYDHDVWPGQAAEYAGETEGGRRCTGCFMYSLTRTAETARDMGLKIFSTTLTVSPYKNSGILFDLGKNIAGQYSMEFGPWNFKKENGYLRSLELSRELGLYRQNFCGCEFSFASGSLQDKTFHG